MVLALALTLCLALGQGFVACSPEAREAGTRFVLLPEKVTGVGFANQVTYTEAYNTYTYRNFYNGAGVGLGDFDGDGLTDLYFCGNQEDNRLYRNRGDFRFEDVTEAAGVACSGAWSTGVSVADVNGDGLPDIYVCKSGRPDTPLRKNELFINRGDLTFSEEAEAYGLDAMGLCNHAAFFDADRDGDLDCYLLCNSFESVTDFDMVPGQREIPDSLGANRLFRNDGGRFTDVTREAGIYSSKIGFGLGVSVADLNRDGWMDLYVSNDFFERDYLYLNDRTGRFREVLPEQIPETSLGAMGADVADINNDAWPDIFVTEMTAEGNRRLKTKVLFEDWDSYREKVDKGYHRQFARNVLQLNNRNGSFSEIGRCAGVEATDWSWGALIMDLDNDGWRDLFVANGIYKDLLDRDYLDLYSNPAIMRERMRTEDQAILGLIDEIPSEAIPNYVFHNNHDLTFTNVAGEWGLGQLSFSNGAAYGDLDNDGDLDLVVNNVNMPSFLYRNDSRTTAGSKNNAGSQSGNVSQDGPGTNFLNISLNGTGMNTAALGASVTLHCDGSTFYQECMPIRGFKSTSDARLHFGLGDLQSVDSLVIRWPDGRETRDRRVAAGQFLRYNQADAGAGPRTESDGPVNQKLLLFQQTGAPSGEFVHSENPSNDFHRDALLFHMRSTEGPRVGVADVNGDGLDDLYLCGAKDMAGMMLVQGSNGRFRKTNLDLMEKNRLSEETDCLFFDADGDGDADLYVCCGGNEFPVSSSALADRLYLNDGREGSARGANSSQDLHFFVLCGCGRCGSGQGPGFVCGQPVPALLRRARGILPAGKPGRGRFWSIDAGRGRPDSGSWAW
ncbi:MAG: CRTAC1 family protein [Bacteroidales bacterium]